MGHYTICFTFTNPTCKKQHPIKELAVAANTFSVKQRARTSGQVTGTFCSYKRIEGSKVIASNFHSRLANHLRWFKFTPIGDLSRGVDYPKGNASREPVQNVPDHPTNNQRVSFSSHEMASTRQIKLMSGVKPRSILYYR